MFITNTFAKKYQSIFILGIVMFNYFSCTPNNKDGDNNTPTSPQELQHTNENSQIDNNQGNNNQNNNNPNNNNQSNNQNNNQNQNNNNQNNSHRKSKNNQNTNNKGDNQNGNKQDGNNQNNNNQNNNNSQTNTNSSNSNKNVSELITDLLSKQNLNDNEINDANKKFNDLTKTKDDIQLIADRYDEIHKKLGLNKDFNRMLREKSQKEELRNTKILEKIFPKGLGVFVIGAPAWSSVELIQDGKIIKLPGKEYGGNIADTIFTNNTYKLWNWKAPETKVDHHHPGITKAAIINFLKKNPNIQELFISKGFGHGGVNSTTEGVLETDQKIIDELKKEYPKIKFIHEKTQIFYSYWNEALLEKRPVGAFVHFTC